MKKETGKKKPYHHKNLKEEIIRTSLDFIGQKGYESISLREIAAKIGVAHTAIYHHYKNKNDLLADIAANEFENLVASVKKRNARSNERSFERLFNYGNMYVEYSLENPNLFKLMLGKQPFELSEYPRLVALAAEALSYLVEIVKECQDDGIVKKGDPLKISLGIWSMSHGLAMLFIDNRIDTLSIYGFKKDFSTREITEYIFDVLKNGLLIETKKFY